MNSDEERNSDGSSSMRDEESNSNSSTSVYLDENEIEDFKNGHWPFGGRGRKKDVPLPKRAACLQINKVLARADENAGDFSFGGQAESLPSVPGLIVDGVGSISVPLNEATAKTLIAVSDKSPFGRHHETLLDENVRKSWQLNPDRVKLENPLWHSGLKTLSVIIADRLGYKGVVLECKLYKLLVYAEGGHFTKHRDTEKEDGMIATLVIQPPSSHEGGDLVVYRNGIKQYRYNFGRNSGMAAYLPHYAVHYADAEHSLEEVTKGYRLALVYSICLPPRKKHLRKDHYPALSEDLAVAIRSMDAEDDFVLLLSHQYTEKSIEELGVGALKGIDRARYHAIEEANEEVPSDKKLHFFIAKLEQEIEFRENAYESMEERSRVDSISWYSMNGGKLKNAEETDLELNLLNPGLQSISCLWESYGTSTHEGDLGNEGASRNTTYSRYAIIVWPAVEGVKNAMRYINETAAFEVFQSQNLADAAALCAFREATFKTIDKDTASKVEQCQKPTESAALITFMDMVRGMLEEDETVFLSFFRGLSKLVVKVGDPALASRFFKDFWERVPRDSDVSLVPSLASIVRAFEWSDIGEAILSGLDISSPQPSMTIALHLADSLQSGDAQEALWKKAMEKVMVLSSKKLCRYSSVGLLWKWIIRCNDKTTIKAVANKFRQVNPSLLGPAIAELSQHLAGLDEAAEKFGVLADVVAIRVKWLNHQVRALDKPFLWEMPDAKFPKNQTVEAFLRGPEESMNTKGVQSFKDLRKAQNYAAKWMRRKQINASFEMEAEESDGEVFVTITKTLGWFSKRQELLQQYKAELSFLKEQCRAVCGDGGTSRKQP